MRYLHHHYYLIIHVCVLDVKPDHKNKELFIQYLHAMWHVWCHHGILPINREHPRLDSSVGFLINTYKVNMETISLKSIIIGVLMLGLVLQQTHIEAKSCCCSTTTRNCYNVCRVTGSSRPTCASLCGCKILEKCVPSCNRLNLVTDGGKF